MTRAETENDGFSLVENAADEKVIASLQAAFASARRNIEYSFEYSMRHVLKRVPLARRWCDLPRTRLGRAGFGRKLFPRARSTVRPNARRREKIETTAVSKVTNK